MNSGMRLLLHLPSPLRQQILIQEPTVHACIIGRRIPYGHAQTRTFASAGTRLAKQTNAGLSKSIKKSSQPTKLNPTGASKGVVPPPAARPVPTITRISGQPFIDTFEPSSSKVLLYASPSHGSFFTASYLIGGFFLIGGYCYAEMFLKERPGQKVSWYLKAVGGLSTFFVVCVGTAFVLAPMKLVKSISIISATTAQGPRMLQFEVKRALPFLKPDLMEALPSKVSMDPKVPMTVQDLSVYSVPLADSQTFTEQYFLNPKTTQSDGALGVLSSFNKSLLRTWPTIKRETRRMFLRDQMAYIEVAGNGKFKLDLQDCYMLDEGKPLHKIITANSSASPSIASWIGGFFKR